VTPGNEGPVYPAEAGNFQYQWMERLGDGSHTWDDVAGVIGGYGWNARFVGTDGYIIGTAGSSFPDAGGGHNQINFFGGKFHGWVDYDAAKKPNSIITVALSAILSVEIQTEPGLLVWMDSEPAPRVESAAKAAMAREPHT
jgi:hypothetical protein